MMSAHMTEPRCWIRLNHIGGLFQAGFVARRKWFRWAVGIQRQDRPVIDGEKPQPARLTDIIGPQCWQNDHPWALRMC